MLRCETTRNAGVVEQCRRAVPSPHDHSAAPNGVSGLPPEMLRNQQRPMGIVTEIDTSEIGTSADSIRTGAARLPSASRACRPESPNGDHNGRYSAASLPMTVKDAARFLGVSPQTVYLWVERKQIPHLRVMGRNIRFLLSDLEPFRAQFKREVGSGKTA